MKIENIIYSNLSDIVLYVSYKADLQGTYQQISINIPSTNNTFAMKSSNLIFEVQPTNNILIFNY